MASLDEIIARAQQIAAGRGMDPAKSPVADASMTLEALYYHALRFVIARNLKAGGSPEDYRRTFYVMITDGVGETPEGLLRDHLCSLTAPGRPYLARVPYADYQRHRHDGLLDYLAINGNQLYFAGEMFPTVASFLNNIDMSDGTASIVDASLTLTSSAIGLQAELLTSAGAAVIKSIVNTVPVLGQASLRGQSLQAVTGGALTIRDNSTERVVRTFTSVTTNQNSVTVTAAGAAFTSADLYRRLRVYQGTTLMVDAYIVAINSATSVDLSAEAVDTTVTGTGEILHPYLELTGVGVPDAPANSTDDIDMSPALTEDVIVTMAAAILGDIRLSQLTSVV